jgi:hypothetical protein
MIVLLIAALAVVALVAAGGSWIAGSRTRARRDRDHDRLDRARRAAAAARTQAEEERRRADVEASDALTSVIPAIKLPWRGQPPGIAAYDEHPAAPRGDYPAFSATPPFRADEEPGWYPGTGRGMADRGPGGFAGYPGEPGGAPDGAAGRAVPAPRPAERHSAAQAAQAEHRAVADSHRGGHAKRRRG